MCEPPKDYKFINAYGPTEATILRLYLKWTNIIQMSRSEKHLTM